jgi:hypothetical protein
MNVNADRRVAEITLERYHLKELPAPVMARLEQRLHEDEDLRRRLELLAEADAELRASGQLAMLDARVRRALTAADGAARPRTWSSIPRWAVLTAVATSVVLTLVFPRLTSFTEQESERSKGLQPALTLYRRVGASSETLADGTVTRPGDLIRVGYRAAGRAYGLILSIDGRGHVTMHLPSTGEEAAPLGREPVVLLDQAFELDDAPRYEQFYFVTSNAPFAVAPVVAAAHQVAATGRPQAAAPLAIAADLEQTTFSLLKESQP